MPRKKTTTQFIQQSRAIYGNKYGYQNTKYLGNDIKVIITCQFHGDIEVLPQKHTGQRREECKYCKGFVPKVEKITQEYLMKWFEYNPENGIMKNRGTNLKMGTIDNGYMRIGIQGEKYMIHRLAFLYMTGKMPEIVDHIDRDRLNNKWENLRVATWSLNNLNKDDHKNVYQEESGKYIGVVQIDKETYRFGPFDTYIEAEIDVKKFKETAILLAQIHAPH